MDLAEMATLSVGIDPKLRCLPRTAGRRPACDGNGTTISPYLTCGVVDLYSLTLLQSFLLCERLLYRTFHSNPLVRSLLTSPVESLAF